MTPITTQVEELKSSFECVDEVWYVQVANAVSDSYSEEDALMSMVREEMAQFYDVVNDKEFRQIEQKYPNSRVVLYKLAEKTQELDK